MSVHATASAAPEDQTASTLARVEWGLLQVAYFVGTLVWTGFWINVARLQWTLNGSELNVLFIGATLVAPALVLYADHALSLTDRTDYEHEILEEVPTPAGV